MSNKELDNLFKSKLETINKKPGDNAWKKINSQIESNDNINNDKAFPFMRVAAAVVLLISFSFAIKYALDTNSETNDKTFADNGNQNTETKRDVVDSSIKKDKSIAKPNELLAEKNDEMDQANSRNSQPSTNKSNKNSEETKSLKNTRKTNKTSKETAPAPIESIDQNNNIAQVTEENILPEATIETQVASNIQKVENKPSEVEQKGQTIELNLSDFEKTATAQNDQSQAKSDTAKGFKKILNIMDEVGIGDLRKAKNELFALNSKKDSNANSK